MLNELLCGFFGCKEVVTKQGYPAYETTWTIYSHCTRCGKKYATKDDLFIGERPSDFPLSLPFMSVEQPPPFNGGRSDDNKK